MKIINNNNNLILKPILIEVGVELSGGTQRRALFITKARKCNRLLSFS